MYQGHTRNTTSGLPCRTKATVPPVSVQCTVRHSWFRVRGCGLCHGPNSQPRPVTNASKSPSVPSLAHAMPGSIPRCLVVVVVVGEYGYDQVQSRFLCDDRPPEASAGRKVACGAPPRECELSSRPSSAGPRGGSLQASTDLAGRLIRVQAMRCDAMRMHFHLVISATVDAGSRPSLVSYLVTRQT